MTGSFSVSRRRCGYTLLETTICLGITSLLLTGLASVVVVSTKSWSQDLSPRRQADAAEVTRRMHDDLRFALQVTEQSDTAATFLVPDRDGDGVQESIRYSWSGTAGAPLTVSINGLPAENLLDEVESFDFDWQSRAVTAPPEGASGVVTFLSNGSGDPNNVTLSAQEQLKVNWLRQSHVVLTVSSSGAEASIRPLVDNSSVLYISGDVTDGTCPGWVKETPAGIVCERAELGVLLGMSDGSDSELSTSFLRSNRRHDLVDDSSSTFVVSTIGSQRINRLVGPFSPDLRILAVGDTSQFEPVLAALETGAASEDGTFTVPARRVLLPSGGPNSDFEEFTQEIHDTIAQSIQWASGAGADALLDHDVLIVASTAPNPTGFEADRLQLLQSLGCNITVIDPDATEADLDAAIALADSVWVSATFNSSHTAATVLPNEAIGIVFEDDGWLDAMGMGSATSSSSSDSFVLANLSHPILHGFSAGTRTMTWSSGTQVVPTSPPSGLQVLAEPSGGSSGTSAIGAVDTGATTHNGSAPGRRVWFTLSQGLSTDMREDMLRLISNSVQWASGG